MKLTPRLEVDEETGALYLYLKGDIPDGAVKATVRPHQFIEMKRRKGELCVFNVDLDENDEPLGIELII